MLVKGLMVLLSCALPLVSVVSSAAADRVVIEDWAAGVLGAKGIPTDWTGQTWGQPRYDFTIVADAERKVLSLKSENERSTITKTLAGRVHLHATPILEWQWKVMTLPAGGDSRQRETMDQAAQLYVVWPRFPQAVRSRIIGYAWDTSAPVGTSLKSLKASTVTYIIVRSGTAELGQWVTERRNLWDDYKMLFGEAPPDPSYISLSIDSNDTHSSAEALIGPILFRVP
jgi:hypothetical protein